MFLRKLCLGCFLTGSILSAAQIVTLKTGQKMRVDRADRDGDQVFVSVASVVTILEAAEIKSIEAERDPNQPAPPPPAPKGPHAETRAMIRAAAKTHGLPAHIIESIAEVESGMKTNAVSHKGAIGVMQLMPGTARQLGVDPHDVAQNIEGGTRLMRELLIRYQDDPDQVAKALAAYNAGPGAVDRYNGVPPYRETQQYVRKILNKLQTSTDSIQ
jgi:soluble lytic murein transglycosylase-like protein